MYGLLGVMACSEAYYMDQGILAPEEWEPFMSSFKAPLPTTFRITPGKPTTRLVQKEMLQNFVPALTGVSYEGEAIPPPKQIEWYPEGLGWQIDVKKNVLRKEEQFKKFQQFLVHETVVVSVAVSSDPGIPSHRRLAALTPPRAPSHAKKQSR